MAVDWAPTVADVKTRLESLAIELGNELGLDDAATTAKLEAAIEDAVGTVSLMLISVTTWSDEIKAGVKAQTIWIVICDLLGDRLGDELKRCERAWDLLKKFADEGNIVPTDTGATRASVQSDVRVFRSGLSTTTPSSWDGEG